MDTVQTVLWVLMYMIGCGAAFKVGFGEGRKDERRHQEDNVQEFLWHECDDMMYWEACWKARTIVNGEYRSKLYESKVAGDTVPPMRAHDTQTCTRDDHKVTDFEDLRFGEEE